MRLSASQWHDLCGADEVIGDETGMVGYAYDEAHTDPYAHPGYWNSDWLPGVVGAASSDVHDFLLQTDQEVNTLDADVTIRTTLPGRIGKPPLGAGFNFNEWNFFVNGDPSQDLDEDERFGMDPVPFGWRPYKSTRTLAGRIIRGDAMMAEIGAFRHRFIEFYDSFKDAGGVPTRERPTTEFKPTPDDPNAPTTAESVASSLSSVVWILGLGVLGYVLVSTNILTNLKRS